MADVRWPCSSAHNRESKEGARFFESVLSEQRFYLNLSEKFAENDIYLFIYLLNPWMHTFPITVLYGWPLLWGTWIFNTLLQDNLGKVPVLLFSSPILT